MGILRTTIFGRIKYKPNTFIGGIAKLGGTGVNAPINTRALLASKLSISESRIRVFKVNGDNVECYIKGSYSLPSYCFGSNISADANKNITSYQDSDGLVTSLGAYCFMFCTNFELVNMINLSGGGESTFSYTKISYANFPNILSGSDIEVRMFQNCSELIEANVGSMSGTWLLTFWNTPKFKTLIGGNPSVLDQTFRNSGIESFNRASVIRVNIYSFSLGTPIIDITLINATRVYQYGFYNLSVCTSIIAPKIARVDNLGFSYSSTLELVDIRACKIIYNNLAGEVGTFQGAFKTTGVGRLLVHEFMKTSNGGLADVNLTYLKTSRNVTIEFYDDDGNYVSTL